MLERIDVFSRGQEVALQEVLSMSFDSRKTLAEAVMRTSCPACLFALIDKKAANARVCLC